jgi:translation initiation factor 2 gamma subunit (eIF-2gamma)
MGLQIMKQVILGTAGHIDHGKTSLIKAITGIDTDRLKEEKERGITIELDLPTLSFRAGSCWALWTSWDMKNLSRIWWPVRPA